MELCNGLGRIAAVDPSFEFDVIFGGLGVSCLVVSLAEDRAPEPTLDFVARCTNRWPLQGTDGRKDGGSSVEHCVIGDPSGLDDAAVIAEQMEEVGKPFDDRI